MGLLTPHGGTALVDGVPYILHPTPGLALGTYLGSQQIQGAHTARGFPEWTTDLLALRTDDLDFYLASVGLTQAADRKVAGLLPGPLVGFARLDFCEAVVR